MNLPSTNFEFHLEIIRKRDDFSTTESNQIIIDESANVFEILQ